MGNISYVLDVSVLTFPFVIAIRLPASAPAVHEIVPSSTRYRNTRLSSIRPPLSPRPFLFFLYFPVEVLS
jgi:hypothetical protein